MVVCNRRMDKYEMRRNALQQLVATLGRGAITHIASKIGKDANYVSRMLYEEGKPGGKRIGEESADALEAAFPGWLSGAPLADGAIIVPERKHRSSREKPHSLMDLKSNPSFTLLPVVQFQGLNMMERNDVSRVGGDWVSTPGQFSPVTKVTTMPDDSMYPEIWAGEFIALDPEIKADAGDTVLIKDQHGGLWIRKYRPLPGGQFDAIAANDDHAPLRSTEGGLEVLAVLVGHWRGRRSRRH